jgi:hypothetical protein
LSRKIHQKTEGTSIWDSSEIVIFSTIITPQILFAVGWTHRRTDG